MHFVFGGQPLSSVWRMMYGVLRVLRYALHKTPYVLLLLSPWLIAAAPAQEPPAVTYQRYDVAIELQPDGSFWVHEVQEVRFDGVFRTAFAEIPTEITESIHNVEVYEVVGTAHIPYQQSTAPVSEDQPGRFSTTREEDSLYVDWAYEPTVPGDVRTFVVAYQVFGALWIYPDGHTLEWRAVPADRSGVPVQASRVTVTLPQPVAVNALLATAYGPAYEVAFATADTPATLGVADQASQVVFEVTQPILDGERFQIQVGFPPDLVEARPSPWQIREDAADLQISLPSLITELHIQADGRVDVTEYHTVRVEDGALYESGRTLPTQFVDAIENVEVYEGDQPFVESRANCEYCLRVDQRSRGRSWVTYDVSRDELEYNSFAAGEVAISWFFPPLVRGEQTTFVLRYVVEGAIQIVDEGQRLVWTAVAPGRPVDVVQAEVYVYPPAGLDATDLRIIGGQVDAQADGAVRVRYNGSVPSRQDWVITVAMPEEATAATTPEWQQEIAEVVAEAETAAVAEARLRLAFGGGSLLLMILGMAGLYWLWYIGGRDRPLPPVASYLPEPPSDLPPGIVAYLLDEQPTPKAALAGLFHLASLGFVEIDLDTSMTVRRLANPTAAVSTLPHHLQKLLAYLAPVLEVDQDVSLFKVEPRFVSALPAIYTAMGEEVAPFFDTLPGQSRHRWLVRGQWGVILSVMLALILAMNYTERLGWLALAPAASLLLVGVGLILISRWMPRRTDSGVQEAERWRAFKRYLSNLKDYASVIDAQHILDRYFAYAVALGIETIVLESAADLGTRIPSWTVGPQRRRPTWSQQPVEPSMPTASHPTPQLPDRPPLSRPESRSMGKILQQASHSLGHRLAQSSERLGQLFSTAAGETSTPFQSLEKGAVSTLDVLGTILREAAASGGSSNYSGGGSSSSSSWGSSRSSSRSHSSFSGGSRSSGRSSSSRRSGGGGRRGFGR